MLIYLLNEILNSKAKIEVKVQIITKVKIIISKIGFGIKAKKFRVEKLLFLIYVFKRSIIDLFLIILFNKEFS